MKELVVDGKNYLYIGGHHGHQAGLSTRQGEQTGFIYGFLNYFRDTLDTVMPDAVTITWDGGRLPQRIALLPTYKRRPTPMEPEQAIFQNELMAQLPKLEAILAQLPVKQVRLPDIEGDDIIGEIVLRLSQAEEIVIASSDKDFYQLISDKVSIWSPMKKVLVVPANVNRLSGVPEGIKYTDYLALVGDMGSDQVPGVQKGYGPKAALKALEKYGSLENMMEQVLLGNKVEKLNDGWVDVAFRNLELVELGLLLNAEQKNLISKTYREAPCEYKDTNLKLVLRGYEFQSILKHFDGWDKIFRHLEHINHGHIRQHSIPRTRTTSEEGIQT